jgi:hypothetical protein
LDFGYGVMDADRKLSVSLCVFVRRYLAFQETISHLI